MTILDGKVGRCHVFFTCLFLKKKDLRQDPSVLGLVAFEIFHYNDDDDDDDDDDDCLQQEHHHHHHFYYFEGDGNSNSNNMKVAT